MRVDSQPCLESSLTFSFPCPGLPRCSLHALSCVTPLPWGKMGVLLAWGYWGAPWRNGPAPAVLAEWAEPGFPSLSLSRRCPMLFPCWEPPGFEPWPANSSCSFTVLALGSIGLRPAELCWFMTRVSIFELQLKAFLLLCFFVRKGHVAS